MPGTKERPVLPLHPSIKDLKVSMQDFKTKFLIAIFFYYCPIMDTQKNRLTEMVLLSTPKVTHLFINYTRENSVNNTPIDEPFISRNQLLELKEVSKRTNHQNTIFVVCKACRGMALPNPLYVR